jgi:hypothetical protein
MSNYRLATILAKKAYTADFVEPIDIDLTDPVSQITILYKSQSQGYAVGSSADYRMPVSAITKIELVDGSDVLFSLSGKEAQAVDFYHNKKEPLNETRLMNDGWSHSVVNINFGRWLYDPQLAFDPTKFDNPQLKITGDISAGACDSDNARLTVLGHVFHAKKISPSGFLMQKEIKSYDLVDEGHEYTDLPTDYPYRKLLLRAQREGYLVSAQVKRIKLTEDNDRTVIVNELTDEVLTAMLQNTPPYQEYVLASGNNASGYYPCTPAQRFRVIALPWTTVATADNYATYEGGGGRFQADGSVGTANVQFWVQGWCPHGVLEIPFGDQLDINDWYTPAKSVKADITGDQSTGTAEIILQQYRRY